MQPTDGRLPVSFIGETYSYLELREQLIAHRCDFRSDSDIEVLLHLHRMHGKQMLPLLRGMFAFALWGEDEEALLLARNPFGIKPLYYADDGHCTCFASQAKTILAGGAVDSTPDAAGRAGGNFSKQMLADMTQWPVHQGLIGKIKTGFSTPIARWTGKMPAEAVEKRPLSGGSNRNWLQFVSHSFGLSLSSARLIVHVLALTGF